MENLQSQFGLATSLEGLNLRCFTTEVCSTFSWTTASWFVWTGFLVESTTENGSEALVIRLRWPAMGGFILATLMAERLSSRPGKHLSCCRRIIWARGSRPHPPFLETN